MRSVFAVLQSVHVRGFVFFFGAGLALSPSLAPIAASTEQQTEQQAVPLVMTDLDLLVAIGVAEGTRTLDGGFTAAWHGHSDPGNQAWNLGSCSWQSSPVSTPQEADQLCLSRLREQLSQVPAGASDFVLLAYLDAWVQAPLAAQDFFRLLEGATGTTEFERVLNARVKSFIDPTTGLWDAPGLGNDPARIEADQRRRLTELQRYLQHL